MRKILIVCKLSRRKLLLSALMLLYSFVAFSQEQITVKGTVLDSTENKPLIGVSVSVEGKTQGTITDNQGKYTITTTANATLIFRYVGYNVQRVRVDGKTLLNIRLYSSTEDLQQVVVVGYGTQKKATVTGAIASIQTKEIKQSPAANLAVSLAGRLPGLTAIQRSGEPGRDVTQLLIRGRGTVNSQSPIILVDGVERELNYIDPNEVESVSILKDASSTAIFGVRGANGVILVTTRRGTSEVPEISFTAEGSAQDFTRKVSTVDSYDYATLRNLSLTNDGLAPAYSDKALALFKSGEDPLRYPNTNWRDILLKDYSLQQRYNLNISGASKATKYFVNAGYLNQGGQFKTEKDLPYDPSFNLNRYNFRSNVDMQLNKSLKAFLNVAGYLEKQNSPAGILGLTGDDISSTSTASSIISYLYYINAATPGPLTPDGGVMTHANGGGTGDHPGYGQINRSGYIKQTRSNVTATFGMEQSLDMLTQGLSLKAIVSFDTKSLNNLYAIKNYEKYVQVIDPNNVGPDGKELVSYRLFNADKNTPLNIYGKKSFTALSNIQGYLNYNRTFNKHAVSGLILYQQQQTVVNEELPYNLRGVSGRFTYGYDNKYFAEFNAGYNGSEQFIKGSRFGFFPAYSAGWLISNEDFLRDNKVISMLKLRGSYGEVGNDRIGGKRFIYLDDIQVTSGGYSGSLGISGQRIKTNLLGNPALQWEVAKKANIGLELGVFNSLTLVADVFKEKRNNVLRRRGTIPILNGLSSGVLPPVNIGVIENKGFELELIYKKAFNNDFSMLAKANVSFARNKQLQADEPLRPEDFAYRYRETNFRIGQTFGYYVDRYFENAADVANSPIQNVGGHASRPGDFKYKDLNGDNIINEKDMGPIGYSDVPEYNFGATLGINYKNFDISVLIQGATNVTNFYGGPGVFPWDNFVKRHKESWTEERFANGEPINFPRLTTQGSPNETANSFFIIDASFIRLKNAEIGYSLPKSIAGKIGAKNIRFYTNGLNLLTWDRLPSKEFDPELSNGVSYPVVRLYNLGVNVTF